MTYQPQVRSIVDAGNSSTTPLGIGVTYVGTWIDITVWQGISVLVDGTSVTPAEGTLFMEFSHNGSTVNRSIAITTDDIAATAPRTLGTVAQFFRIRYTNGSVALTHGGLI